MEEEVQKVDNIIETDSDVLIIEKPISIIDLTQINDDVDQTTILRTNNITPDPNINSKSNQYTQTDNINTNQTERKPLVRHRYPTRSRTTLKINDNNEPGCSGIKFKNENKPRIKQWRCKNCPRTFKKEFDLLQHMNSKHMQNNIFVSKKLKNKKKTKKRNKKNIAPQNLTNHPHPSQPVIIGGWNSTENTNFKNYPVDFWPFGSK